MPRYIEGDLNAVGQRIGIIVSRFNSFITDRLLDGATDALLRHGANENDIHVVQVPGAFEIPLIARKMASARTYDGIIALGAVIRGATPHFDYVSSEVTKGIAAVSLEHGIPIAFGVLTTDSIEQAVERAGAKAGNKGFDAALTVIESINVLKALA